jgi:beta-glucosidase
VTLSPGRTTTLSYEIPLSALEFWDVSRSSWRLDPGPYDLLVGASSEDVRLRTTITLTGTPATPRPLVERGLSAADFDDHTGAELVDRTKRSGDAVTPAGAGPAELVYRACDFGTGVTGVTFEVAGAGTVELSLDGGEPVVTVSTPASDPYAYTTVSAPLTAEGVHDVRVGLGGEVRLARVEVSR